MFEKEQLGMSRQQLQDLTLMPVGANDTEDCRVVDVQHLRDLPLILVMNNELVYDVHLLVWVQEEYVLFVFVKRPQANNLILLLLLLIFYEIFTTVVCSTVCRSWRHLLANDRLIHSSFFWGLDFGGACLWALVSDINNLGATSLDYWLLAVLCGGN